jgi:hypothetical protein
MECLHARKWLEKKVNANDDHHLLLLGHTNGLATTTCTIDHELRYDITINGRRDSPVVFVC